MTDLAELCTKPIAEVAPLIQRGEVSPVALTEAMLARIERVDRAVKSYLLVTAEHALEQAGRAEREIRDGRYRGKLHGIPIGIKDLVYTKRIPTTCASTILKDWRPDFDATVMTRLDEAGAICMGKLNMTEFALYGYHPAFEPPRNPWNLDYWAGVSSSGSGAATAASLCYGALGTDTGGSIRFPSAACGIVGIKPTFGKISRHGVFPLADTLDHVGPMTRTVADAAAMLAVLEGRDENDPSTRSDPPADYESELSRGVAGLCIALDRDYCTQGADPAMTQATFRAAELLAELGAEIVDVRLHGLTDVCEYWTVTAGVDALIRHREFFPARAGEYGPVFRALLEYGAAASAEDYARGQKLRQATFALLAKLFTGVDAMMCPAAPNPPAPQAEVPPQQVLSAEEIASLVRYAGPFNFAGNPSVVVPNGFTDDGLPLSMQFIGRHGDEAVLIRIAAAYEQATDWHRRRPPVQA